jgi:sulfur-carrier protein adenylyltransferase/sulfurtransferase
MLTAAELSRYARQLILPDVGIRGQERLRAARIAIVGAGGLGSPVALYLAGAGIGQIGIIDDDALEISNLHRQVIHGTSDIGRLKAESAADAVRRLNPHVEVHTHTERLTPSRAEGLLAAYDVVVDGSDNYPTRYAVNDACATSGTPWVYGSVERFAGQVSVFGTHDGPCYRCLFPDAPAPGTTSSCEEIGVLGAVPGVVGSLQAVEALKLVLGVGTPLAGRLLQLDLRAGTVASIEVSRREDCATCARRGTGAGETASQPAGLDEDIEPAALARRLDDNSLVLVDIREPWEWSIASIGHALQLPMNQLPGELGRLDRSRELVIYCHHGVRSQMAAGWLRGQGFRARNLVGGIDRWSREIDTTLARY